MFRSDLPGGTKMAAIRLSPDNINRETAMTTETRAPEYKEADRQMAGQPGIPAAEARQAVMGHNVRYVLGFGIAAVVIAFAIVYLVYFV